MVGSLTNLMLLILAKSSGKNSSKVWISVHGKSGPSCSDPAEVVLGSKAKMFPTIAALIFVNLGVDAELDEVSTMTSFPLPTFLVMGRSMRRSILVGKMK